MLQIIVSAFLLSLASAQNQDDFSLAVTIPGVPGKCQLRFECDQLFSFRRGLSDFLLYP